jgi:hypothetical protein
MKTGTRAHTVPQFYLKSFVSSEIKPGLNPFVWYANLRAGKVIRRSPKSISVREGFYDGPGGLDQPGATIEKHLAGIEHEAAMAIREFVADGPKDIKKIPKEIWRFLAWQAARTPGWMEQEGKLMGNWDPNEEIPVVEPPPEGIANIFNRERDCLMENQKNGVRRTVRSYDEFKKLIVDGWFWIPQLADRLEALHMQAWYFQVRHFPRLCWTLLKSTPGNSFVTSDRVIAWIVDGYLDTPPAALRHPDAQVVAPLTPEFALVGRNATHKLNVEVYEVNRLIACLASKWILGNSKIIVEQALADRQCV